MRKFILFTLVLGLLIAATAFAADLRSNIMQKHVTGPVSVSNNDNTTGAIIDTLGYGSLTYVIDTGTLADSDVTLTPTIQQCAIDNCDDAVTATSFVGTIAGATFAAADDNTSKSVGVNFSKRYSRIIVTPANNSSAAAFDVIAILGHPKVGATQ